MGSLLLRLAELPVLQRLRGLLVSGVSHQVLHLPWPVWVLLMTAVAVRLPWLAAELAVDWLQPVRLL